MVFNQFIQVLCQKQGIAVCFPLAEILRVIRAIRWQIAPDCLLMPAVSVFFPTNYTNYTNLFFCCAGGTKKNASPDRVLNADGFILSKLAVICLPDCVIQAGNRDSKKACRFLIHRIQFRMVSQKRIVNPCALYIRVASAEGRQEPE